MKKLVYVILIVLHSVLFASCSHYSPHKNLPEKQRAPNNDSGQITIIDENYYDNFQSFNGDYIVKFTLLKNGSGKYDRILIQNTKLFQFHYQFLNKTPEFLNMTQAQIDEVTLRNTPNRKALLGLLLLRQQMPDADLPPQSLIYIMSDEAPSAENVLVARNLLYSAISEQLKQSFGDLKNFTPTAGQMAEVMKNRSTFDKVGLKIVTEKTPDRLSYNSGWGAGTIYIAATEKQLSVGIASGKINSKTILVVGEDMRELPPVAGLISAVPLTPASHIVLLAQMYNMPCVYLKNATGLLHSNADQNALLVSHGQMSSSFQLLTALSADDYQILNSAKMNKSLNVNLDETTVEVVDVTGLSAVNVPTYGGKASRFGLLRRTIPDSSRDKAAAISIGFFRKFLKTAQASDGVVLENLIQKKLSFIHANSTYSEVAKTADEIREAMLNTAIPAALVSEIRTKLIGIFGPTQKFKVKLRSSSNVEDGTEFNGAGLYESKGACLFQCDKEDFAKSLSTVWASLYTARGLWARHQFSVDESKVGMGVLVHAPFKGELFNGVIRISGATKKNLEESQIDIISQIGEEASVTNATSMSSEVTSIRRDELTLVQAQANQPNSRFMMKQDSYFALAELIKKVASQWDESASELDLEGEWKIMPNLDGTEKAFLKQIRAVPRPSTFKTQDNSEFLFFTQKKIRLKAFWNARSSSPRGILYLQNLNLPIENFTANEFKNEKLKFGEGDIKIQGNTYKLKVNSFKFKGKQDGALTGVVELTAPPFNKMSLTMQLYPDSSPLPFSAFSDRVGFRFSMFDPPVDEPDNSWGIVLTNPEDQESDYSKLPPKYSNHVYKMRKCKTTFEAITDASVYNSYGELTAEHYTSLKIKNLLPSIPEIKLNTDLAIVHTHVGHTGNHRIFLDLFADPKLKISAKEELKKRVGRYLYFAGFAADATKSGNKIGSIRGMSELFKYRDIKCWEDGDDVQK